MSNFQQVILSGADTNKFLQGQLTVDVDKVGDTYQATAICSLKGRLQFGIWIKSVQSAVAIVIHHSCLEELVAHIKKYGAFSRITLTEAAPVYPCVIDEIPTFTDDVTMHDELTWQSASIATGNYWLTADSQLLFQPQELRLHQRNGVHYDKGCYIGQEVVARIYFRSAPKAFLHRIIGVGNTPTIGEKIGENNKVLVVNAIAFEEESDLHAETRFEALVIARDNHLEGFEKLPLPLQLQEDIARKTIEK